EYYCQVHDSNINVFF
nr:immunoglobulin light chain junction region [Macaca mulatta]MOX28433.1 immunoglobulin light chain junction region [Macaca mulatta]MOX28541.1 immunoglobulin light chain junction region [Macaca mulatta]MOX28762.1 immunoglobulin light chain junction region [Macaca mulatta]MOX29694.1 immunoglobulin light chain junction region [Macaca mulatta]